MADEDMDGNTPIISSEVRSLHVDSSPETTCQPSQIEDRRVSSSTDRQPTEVADSPNQQRVSSTSDQKHPSGAGHSSWLPEELRFMLETNEAVAVERGSSPSQRSPPVHEPENQPEPDALPYTILRRFLEAPPLIIHSEAQSVLIQAALDRAAVESALVHATLGSSQVQKAVGSGQMGLSQEITKGAVRQHIDEKKSDYSN